MIFLPIDEKGNILYVHYQPFDKINGLGKTKEELLQLGVLLESLPEPKQIPGKLSIMKWDITSKQIYYDYVDVPLTQDELINNLQEENAMQLIDMAIRDIKINSLEEESAMQMLLIAQLQAGGAK